MNSTVLATTTHVRVQIINKCKAMMASRRLYKKGSPHEERDRKKGMRTEEQKNN